MKLAFKYIVLILLISVKARAGEVLFQCNSFYYTNGEDLKAVVYFNNLAANGKVLRLELVDDSLNLIDAFYAKVEGSRAEINYTIPYQMISGNKKIYVSGTSNDGEVIDIIASSIFIFNTTDKERKLNFEYDASPLKPHSYDLFKWNQSGNSYNFQKVNEGSLVSNLLCDASYGEEPNINIVENITQTTIDKISNKIIVRGMVSLNGKPSKQDILGIYRISKDSFLYAKSDVDGKFHFRLDDFSNYEEFQFLPSNLPSAKLKFELLQSTFRNRKIYTIHKSSNLLSPMYDEYKKKNIFKLYFNEASEITNTATVYKNKFNLKPQKKYKPANYNKFEYFYQFCKENNAPLRFELKDNKYHASVFIAGYYAKKFEIVVDYPIFMIDGKLTRNYDAIARLKVEDIELIEIFTDVDELRKMYSAFGKETFIKLSLKNGKNLLSKLEQENTLSFKGFIINDSKKMLDIQREGPDFSQIIHWSVDDKHENFNVKENGIKGGKILHTVFTDKQGKIRLSSLKINE
ncbi:MAG: hypothetical protein RLZZ546_3168 [Bacteroidota bacterium]|jgi:hypothetical protein